MMRTLSLSLLFAAGLCAPAPQANDGAAVPLWGTCNQPNIGVYGPLPCAEGQCICKDSTYSQCRTQISGSWADQPWWQCQNPGDQPTGVAASNPSSSGITNSGLANGNEHNGNDRSGSVDNLATGNTDDGTDSTNNDDGSSSSTVNNPDSSSANSGVPSTSPTSTTTGSMGGDGDLQQVAMGFTNVPATVGTCADVKPPSGWQVATTTFYGYMGSSCNCGHGNLNQAPWQANTGPAVGLPQGYYSGAVNNKIFQGALNSAGQPNCGQTCGQCYDLITSGVNSYNGGVGGGSPITVMIVDACYNTAGAPHWCNSNDGSGSDDFGCNVHFDIDTDPTSGNVPVTGLDGTTWSNGGQMVFWRPSPNGCPSNMTDVFKQDCAPNCSG